MLQVNRITARIIAALLIFEEQNYQVFSLYAAQTGKLQEEKSNFWEAVGDEIGRTPASDVMFVGGDLNGHVVVGEQGFEDVMRLNGFREGNRAGESILKLCHGRELRIINKILKYLL